MNKRITQGISTPLAIGIIIIAVIIIGGWWIFANPSEIVNDKPAKETPLSLPDSYNAWIALINHDEPLCLGVAEGMLDENNTGFNSYTADSGVITVVLCETFAYQSNYAAVYSDASGNTVIPFTEYSSSAQSHETKTPIELRFDQDKKTFSSYAKGRGAGDCGSTAEYIWNKDSKTAELTEFRLQECNGGSYEQPWPLIYPAQ